MPTTFSVLFDQKQPTASRQIVELARNRYEMISVQKKQLFVYKFIEGAEVVKAEEYKFEIMNFIKKSEKDI